MWEFEQLYYKEAYINESKIIVTRMYSSANQNIPWKFHQVSRAQSNLESAPSLHRYFRSTGYIPSNNELMIKPSEILHIDLCEPPTQTSIYRKHRRA
jgi:hypothetical protein